MSKITAINKIIEFRRNLYYRIYHPDLDSNLPIDEVSEMIFKKSQKNKIFDNENIFGLQ